MPKVDEQQVALEAVKVAQQPQQNAAQQAHEKLRVDVKDLLKDLRDQLGTDQKALDQLNQVNQKLDRLESKMGSSADKKLDPELAEQLQEAVKGDPDAQRQLDEQTEQSRQNLADAQEQLKHMANDPTVSDEQFLKDRAEYDAAIDRFEQFTVAQATLKVAQASQQLEREVSQIREDLQQGMTAQQATDRLHQVVDDLASAENKEFDALHPAQRPTVGYADSASEHRVDSTIEARHAEIGELQVRTSNLYYHIDHYVPQSRERELRNKASNLGFLIADENMRKNDSEFRVLPETLDPVSLADARKQGPDAYRRAVGEMLGGRRFSEVCELNELWQLASRNETAEYGDAQRAFRQLIGNSELPAAEAVRDALRFAGVSVVPTKKSFILRLDDSAYRGHRTELSMSDILEHIRERERVYQDDS